MRIYCICARCHNKIHLSQTAKTRTHLTQILGGHFEIICPTCTFKNVTSIHFTFAETSFKNLAAITAVGLGVVGLIAGPVGIFVGLSAGGLGGSIAHSNDAQAVKKYNDS